MQAVKKHLIALSDGLTPNMDFEALLRDAAAHHITVTTVAVGKDADRTLMAAIAHWGNGRSYYTDDPLHIPRIFTAETMLVARELIEEQPFQPVLQREHEILQGLALAQLPPLYGYIVTYGKPAAEILLATPKGDPLLAVQRYGLGRTAAFTADLSARWGREWVRWPQFPRFAAQLVRWLQRKVTTESFEVRVDVREGHGVVQADVYDAANRFVNHLQLQGRLLTPQHETLPVAFTQVAPGRYRGQFPLRGNGDYLLTLVGTHNGTTLGPKTVGVAVPYSPEYLGLDTNYGLLNRLAERTGGQVLRLDAPQEAAAVLFASSGQDFTTLQDLWPWLVLVALGFFIAEIVVRQVIMATRGEEAPGSSSEPAAGYTYPALMEVVHRRTADRRRWRRS
ncbi:MAG: hypothetical protein KatS3mg131_0656 [Candidatus Tectimicrobiota bacterium]|nr:MAG: hypothetical protein KatS3mg131_0656 [Candidatus Tectomicrobia bacterium]